MCSESNEVSESYEDSEFFKKLGSNENSEDLNHIYFMITSTHNITKIQTQNLMSAQILTSTQNLSSRILKQLLFSSKKKVQRKGNLKK